MSRPVWDWLAYTFIPASQGRRDMLFPASFSMLRCEAHFAVIIRTCLAAHLSWLICRTQRINGPPAGEEWHHAPSHSTQYPCAASRSASSSSQPSGLISGCSNLSWSLPRMFSSENAGPLLCDSDPRPEDAIAARVGVSMDGNVI
jgi:hypothetical protein